ncbi:transglycosylase family protein, partial [Mycobacterium sp. 852002-40037_SCH5390672]|uniref:transglycosylase family protein n=1 Tax=Mycobacterium sp. 852002-40037_SCH5390672 TaxID=1834089 RepID=UPI000A60289D
MTHPGGGINLAALWIPVMPETSQVTPKLKEAGQQARKAFEEGFGGGGGADNLGSQFGAKFMAGFQKKLDSGDFGALGGVIDKLGAQVDEKLAAKLKGQLPEAYRASTVAANELREAEERLARATELVNDKTQTASMSSFVSARRDQAQATKDVEAATTRATVAQQDYNDKVENFNAASRSAFSASSMLGGLVGGSMVVGFQMLSGAMEGVIHLGEHLFDEALHGAEALTEKLIDVGETYDQLRIQTFEFSGATGEAAQAMNEHVSQLFSTLDVAGKDFGQTYAQLSQMLGMQPGPGLDQLAKTVEELSGRFSNLKAKDVASIFNDFKVPAAEVNDQLGTLVKVSQDAGQSVGTLVSDLSGDAATVLSTFGLSLGQSATFVADLEKHGLPAKAIMTSLSGSLKEMGKNGVDLKGVIKDIVDAWNSGNRVEADKLAGTYFHRQASDLIAVAPELLSVLNSSADAYNSNADAAAQYIDKTKDLNNSIEEFKHHVEGMLAPFGEAALGGLEHALDRVKTWFDENHEKIIDKVKQFGHSFIDDIPEIKDFADTFLGMLQAMAPPLEGFVSMVLAGAAAVEALSGHFDTAGKMLDLSGKFGLSDPIGEAIDKVKPKMDALFDDAIKHSDELKNSFDRAADSASNMFTPPPQGFSYWNDYQSPSFNYPNTPGQPGAPRSSAPPGAPAAPSPTQLPFATPFNQPGTPTPSGQLPSFAPQDSGYSIPHRDLWNRVVQAEASGNWSNADTGHNGHYGGLQFAPSTWDMFGGKQFAPRADQATPEEQMIIAERTAFTGWGGNSPQGLGAWETISNGTVGLAGGGSVGMGLFAGILDSLGMVGGGKGGIDDVLIRATAGEFVMNKEATERYGPLLKLLNAGRFEKGGQVDQFGVNIAGAQIDTIRIADALAQMSPGHQEYLYRSPDGFNEHSSGEAVDFMVGDDTGLGNAVKNWALQQQGVMYALWQQTQWNPDGSSSRMEDRGGATQNHRDHVHIRTVGGGYPQGMGPNDTGLAFGSYPSGTQLSGGGGGGFSAMSAGFGTPGGGGFGGGGMTPSQQLEQQKSIEEANERKDDIERQIQAKTQERAATQGTVTQLSSLPASDPDRQKLPAEQKKLAALDAEIATLEQRKHHAEEDITIANMRANERGREGGRRGERRDDQYNIAEELGRGLLGGIADELGLSNVFGTKAPWEFGAAKLGLGALNWGFGMLNSMGGGGQFPIAGGAPGVAGFNPSLQIAPPTATGLGAPGSPHGWPIGPGNQA